MRVLFLASYFPRPSKPLIGTWALEQARGVARANETRVVCCTPYIPRLLGVLPGMRAWADVPREHVWPAVDGGPVTSEGVRTTYLKGLYYPKEPLKRWAHKDPRRQMRIAWRSIEKRLRAIVDEFKPDVIFAHHSAVNGYFAENIHRLYRIPFVVEDWDYAEIADCARFPHRHELMECVKTAAWCNVVVSKRMEEDTRRNFPGARTEIVLSGINPHPPEIFTTPRPAELQGKQIILSVGMFAVRKAFPILVDAFSRVAAKYPHAVLRIAGDGGDRPAIEAMIQKYRLQDRVTLLGLQSPRRVFQEMVWSDIFALVSWDEPFATVFIEAMGTARPVITASDGGICDVVRHGVHGMIVPPKDAAAAAQAIDELLQDEPRRRAMGERGRELVEQQLNWSANARRLQEIFRDALSSHAVPRDASLPKSA